MMSNSYDTTPRCRKHPAQPVGGICALCLKERLTRLACPRCGAVGSSRVAAASSCSCTPLECTTKLVENPVEGGSSRTIASLIESDIEASKLSNHKLSGEHDDRSAHLLRRSKSISLGTSSVSVHYDWERRSSRGFSLKSELSHPLDGDNRAASTNNRNAGVHEEPEKWIRSEAARENGEGKDNREARETSSPVGMGSAKRVRPLSPARLTKSKSTGWVLNNSWKNSPLWGRVQLMPKAHARVKKLGRKSPSAKCYSPAAAAAAAAALDGEEAVANRLNGSCWKAKRDDCSSLSDSKTMGLRIKRVLQSSWAMLLMSGRNSSHAQEHADVVRTGKHTLFCR